MTAHASIKNTASKEWQQEALSPRHERMCVWIYLRGQGKEGGLCCACKEQRSLGMCSLALQWKGRGRIHEGATGRWRGKHKSSVQEQYIVHTFTNSRWHFKG